MPKMNTYSLVQAYPGGLSVTDAIMIVGNRRRPIRLERAGDAIDLGTVDVQSFALSSFTGMIRRLFLSGVLASVQQEVATDRAADLNRAYEKLNENGGNFVGLAGAPTVIQVEAGMQVGVMGIPDEATRLPDVPTPAAVTQRSQELAPGLVAPGVDPGDGTEQAEAPKFDGAARSGRMLEAGMTAPSVSGDPAAQAPQAEKKPKAQTKKKARKDPAGEAQQAEPAAQSSAQAGFEGWKNNLDFQTQKTRAAESADKDFLGWVAAHDESRQLQKIAAARLAELSR